MSTDPGLQVVGHVHGGRTEPETTPIQSLRNTGEQARLVVLPQFESGLDGLDGFDPPWLISWLDRSAGPPPDLRVVPFLLGHTGERVGVFATRHPSRPSPLALSVVRILRVHPADRRGTP